VSTTIGFIGLGAMGQGMALNLLRKGFVLVVHDLRPEPVATLVAAGARAGGSVAEIGRQCSVIVTMLPGSAEVMQAVMGADGVLANAAPGSLVMDMSTVDPATTDALVHRLREHRMAFVDAPVGRLASHAAAGQCLFMVGAIPSDFLRVKPLLEAMGTTIHHCGEPGTGIRTKLVNNFLAIGLCQMNAEALTLAARFGLDLETTLEVINGTTATNGQLKLNYATKVLRGDVEPGFSIDLAHKDMSLVVNAANAVKVPLPSAASVRESLSLARASGFGGKDFSAVLDHWCERAHVPPIRLKGGHR
jgi:4-hydroxybutyrate dehydrogenase / sulfolactaldehyde 3-reductase